MLLLLLLLVLLKLSADVDQSSEVGVQLSNPNHMPVLWSPKQGEDHDGPKSEGHTQDLRLSYEPFEPREEEPRFPNKPS